MSSSKIGEYTLKKAPLFFIRGLMIYSVVIWQLPTSHAPTKHTHARIHTHMYTHCHCVCVCVCVCAQHKLYLSLYIICLFFQVSSIHYKHHIINSDRRLSNVCRQDDLTDTQWRSGEKMKELEFDKLYFEHSCWSVVTEPVKELSQE